MAADSATIGRLGLDILEFEQGEILGRGELPGDADAGDLTPEDRVQSAITRLLEEARKHYEEELEPLQVEATDYYHGRPFGDEKDGRSRVVSTDVRDVTLGQLPDLIRLFRGPDNLVEFEPQNELQVEQAEQQTDYLNHVIWNDNDGFRVIYGWLLDGLVRKIGIVKWWWEEEERIVEERYDGLSSDQVLTLAGDEDVQDVEILDERLDPAWNTPVYELRVVRRVTRGVARFEGVPNEEFMFTPHARSLDRAQVVAHCREVPVSEVVELGYAYEDIEEYVGRKRRTGAEDLGAARRYDGGADGVLSDDGETFEGDLSQQPILFSEVYAWIDTDGDHIGELRRFACVGPDYYILPDPETGDRMGVPVEDVPFAVFTPYPEPHTVVGLSNHDLLRDIQRIKSQVKRGMLDSLAQAIDAQMEVVQGEVNMRDVMSPEVTKIIRVRKPGMIREVKHTFVGGETISALEYFDEDRAEKTGYTRAEQGLDPSSLQSSVREAVVATLSKGQARTYMIAQVFAEMALKPLMRGLHTLVVQNQDYARVVRLRGKFVEVDPRQWDQSLDLRVNVGPGMTSPQERMLVLSELLTKQETYLQSGVPFVDFTHLRRTLDRLVKLAGYKDSSEFFAPWGPEQQAAWLEQQAANQQPDPATELLLTERMKLQQDQIFRQDELDVKRLDALLRDEREREKIARESALKEFELELKFMTDLQDRTVESRVEMAKTAVTAQVEMAKADAQARRAERAGPTQEG